MSGCNPIYDKLLGLIVTKFTENCTLADAVDTFIAEEYGQQYVEKEYDVPYAAKEALNAIWDELQNLLIEAWHTDQLHDALGMTEDDYAKWVENND